MPAYILQYPPWLFENVLVRLSLPEPTRAQEADLFFRVVSYCYQRGAIGHTTNKRIKDWPETFAGDEVLATAVLDQLLQASHVLNVKDRSYRLRDMEESMKRKDTAPARPEAN